MKECDILVSKFAFTFNLCRYTTGNNRVRAIVLASKAVVTLAGSGVRGGAVQVDEFSFPIA